MANEFNYKNYLKNNPLLAEDKRTDAEEEGYLDGIKDEKEDLKKENIKSSKMTVKEFKAQIKERILAEMTDDLDEMTSVNWKKRNSPAGDSLDLAPKKVGTSTVQEEEDVEVTDDEDINIDVEKDIDIDDKETESDIEVKTSVPGESTEVEAVQGLLTKAQQEAERLGDEKLMAQIGNTITYFTRKHVVKV
tara:strand:+ start:91 stop:663 length:573 start_codon:yes stop_codon:yes gene_type:complete